MGRKRQDVTDAELAILQVLWDCESATVRELSQTLYSGSTASDLATVQKLLQRLEAKGCVQKQSENRPATFRALIDRDALIVRRLEDTADALCNGQFTPLLTHLVNARRLSHRDRHALRNLLNELDQGA